MKMDCLNIYSRILHTYDMVFISTSVGSTKKKKTFLYGVGGNGRCVMMEVIELPLPPVRAFAYLRQFIFFSQISGANLQFHTQHNFDRTWSSFIIRIVI